jgi:hypothetical protein
MTSETQDLERKLRGEMLSVRCTSGVAGEQDLPACPGVPDEQVRHGLHAVKEGLIASHVAQNLEALRKLPTNYSLTRTPPSGMLCVARGGVTCYGVKGMELRTGALA